MSESKFGWAYIGSGGICNTTAKEIVKTGRHRIVSVWSRNRETREALAKHFGAAACATLEDAVSMDGVEGVYIGTPVTAHLEQAKAALQCGKPVLVEKPLCVNKKQAEELLGFAAGKGLFVGEAMWTKFNPVAKQVKAWVDGGAIGKIHSFDARFAVPIVMAKRKKLMSRQHARLLQLEAGGGALLDCGIYPVMYAHYLLGYPESIECKIEKLWTGVDGTDEISLHYAGNAEATLLSSISMMGGKNAVIQGDKGMITVPNHWYATKAVLKNPDGKTTYKAHGGYIAEFDCAAADIREGRLESADSPHADTLAVLAILDACRSQNDYCYNSPYEGKL